MEISKDTVEQMICQIIKEKLEACKGIAGQSGAPFDGIRKQFYEEANGVIKAGVPGIKTTPEDRMNTGKAGDRVYTHDLFSLQESPRLGCGIMEMEATTFDWTLNYDEVDYVIEGSLTIIKNGMSVTAGPGELILIPKGSAIQFSVPGRARFLYVTYPADWAMQG